VLRPLPVESSRRPGYRAQAADTCDDASELARVSGKFFRIRIRESGRLKMVAKKQKQQAADTPKGAVKPKPKKKTSRGK
jgi:hypothetical protein